MDLNSFSISASFEDFGTNGSPGVLSCIEEEERVTKGQNYKMFIFYYEASGGKIVPIRRRSEGSTASISTDLASSRSSNFGATMASTLIECHKFDCFLGENYQTALKKLIQEALDTPCDPNSEKFSSLSSNFRELLLSKPNPPLETIWFYSGLDFRSSSSTENGRPSNWFASIKDLFQLIVARSASFNSWKNIVLIAPVIYELFRFMVDFKGLEMKPKKKKKLVEEVKDLVGSILGYVNVCCEGLGSNFDDMEGLIKPLLSHQAVGRISGGELELSELAGFVIAEAFLLKLCFEFNEGGSKKELQSEMRSWIHRLSAVNAPVKSHFALFCYELLSLLSSFTLVFRDASNDAAGAIFTNGLPTVDYSFLEHKRMTELPDMFVRGISMARLIVTTEAIQLYRKRGNHKKAVSYSSAFSASSLPSQIIKLVRNEIDKEGNTNEPNGSSPAALLRWILNIESHGARIFDDNMSKICAKLVIDDANEDTKQLVRKSSSKKSDEDLLFYIDNKGEEDESDEEDNENEDDDEEMKESMSAAFVAAAHTMQSAQPKQKKRKGREAERKKVKFLKHDLYNDSQLSGGKSTIIQKDDSESGSEVENPSSDDD
nr:SNF2 domain protein [Ipomoea batatas]GME11819.1 SNF2 domain protein [Ipomoea batatas]